MKTLLAKAIVAGSVALALPASAQVANATLNPAPSLGNTPSSSSATKTEGASFSDTGYVITLGSPDARGATPVIRTPVTPVALPPPFSPTASSLAPAQVAALRQQIAPEPEAATGIPPLKISGAHRNAADDSSDDELAGGPK
jgi:hypothetical protein